MKKLFAILALVVLASTISFANDYWTSGDKSATFTAGLFCTPSVSVAQTGEGLGNFFNDAVTTTNALVGEHSATWSIKGPATATYKITFTNPPVNPEPGHPSVLWNGAGSGIAGATELNNPAWDCSLNGDDNATKDIVLHGGITTGGAISCETAVWVKYTATSITIPANHAIPENNQVTFTAHITVEVSI